MPQAIAVSARISERTPRDLRGVEVAAKPFCRSGPRHLRHRRPALAVRRDRLARRPRGLPRRARTGAGGAVRADRARRADPDRGHRLLAGAGDAAGRRRRQPGCAGAVAGRPLRLRHARDLHHRVSGVHEPGRRDRCLDVGSGGSDAARPGGAGRRPRRAGRVRRSRPGRGRRLGDHRDPARTDAAGGGAHRAGRRAGVRALRPGRARPVGESRALRSSQTGSRSTPWPNCCGRSLSAARSWASRSRPSTATIIAACARRWPIG